MGDFSGDGIPDIAYRLETSVEVLLGARDRTLAPAPFPLPLPGPMPPDLRLQTGQRLMIITTSGIDASAYKLRELLRLDQDKCHDLLPRARRGRTPDGSPLALAKAESWSTLPPSSAPVPVGKFGEEAPPAISSSSRARTGASACTTPTSPRRGWNDQAKPVLAAPPTMATITDGAITGWPGVRRRRRRRGRPPGPRDRHPTTAAGPRSRSLMRPTGTAPGAFRDRRASCMGLGWPADGKAAPHLCLSDMHIPPVDVTLAGCETAQILAVADLNGDRVLDIVNACGVFLSPPDPLAPCGLASSLAPLAAAGGDASAGPSGTHAPS